MPLISKNPVQRDIPGEPGEWVKLLKLSAKKLRKAAEVREQKLFGSLPDGGFAAIMASRKNDGSDDGGDGKDEKPAGPPNIAMYDATYLLSRGIHSWSFKEPPGEDPTDQIDQPTEDWMMLEILTLSIPSISKADLKNSAGASTSP